MAPLIGECGRTTPAEGAQPLSLSLEQAPPSAVPLERGGPESGQCSPILGWRRATLGTPLVPVVTPHSPGFTLSVTKGILCLHVPSSFAFFL